MAFTSAMACETNRIVTPRVAHLVNLAHAALAKIDVADRQRFIDQQDLGVHVDRDGERQPHRHAAGVGFHGLIDELADLGEFLDLRKLRVDLLAGEPQNRGVEVDVSRPVNSGLKPAPSSSSAATRPRTSNVAVGGMKNAGDDLQQRAFAGAVLADDAEGLAALDLEADIVERREVVVEGDAIQAQQVL